MFSVKNFFVLFLCLNLSHLPQVAFAEVAPKLIDTQSAVEMLSRQQAEAIIQSHLDKDDVQKELIRYGVDPEDAKKRLASLSDSDLNQMALQMESGQYGGITGILVIVVLVLLIIYLAKRI